MEDLIFSEKNEREIGKWEGNKHSSLKKKKKKKIIIIESSDLRRRKCTVKIRSSGDFKCPWKLHKMIIEMDMIQ